MATQSATIALGLVVQGLSCRNVFIATCTVSTVALALLEFITYILGKPLGAVGRGICIQNIYLRFISKVSLPRASHGRPDSSILLYVCMAITYGKSKDQPGKVANPDRGRQYLHRSINLFRNQNFQGMLVVHL